MLLLQLNRVLSAMAHHGEEDTKEFHQLLEIVHGLSNCRYLNSRDSVPKSDGMTSMLFHYPEREFKQIVRMDKHSFVQAQANALRNRVQNYLLTWHYTNNY